MAGFFNQSNVDKSNFLEEFSKSIKDLKNIFETKTKNESEFTDRITLELSGIRTRIQELKDKILNIKKRISELENEHANLDYNIKQETGLLNSLKNDIEELKQQKSDLESQLQKLESEKNALKETFDREKIVLNDRIIALEGQNEKLEAQILELTQQIDVLNTQIQSGNDTKLKEIDRILNEQNEQRRRNDEEINRLKQELLQKDYGYANMEQQKNNEIQNLQNEINELQKNKIEPANKQIEDLNTQINELKQQNDEFIRIIGEATTTINEIIRNVERLGTEDKSKLEELIKEINDSVNELHTILDTTDNQPFTPEGTKQNPDTFRKRIQGITGQKQELNPLVPPIPQAFEGEQQGLVSPQVQLNPVVVGPQRPAPPFPLMTQTTTLRAPKTLAPIIQKRQLPGDIGIEMNTINQIPNDEVLVEINNGRYMPFIDIKNILEEKSLYDPDTKYQKMLDELKQLEETKPDNNTLKTETNNILKRNRITLNNNNEIEEIKGRYKGGKKHRLTGKGKKKTAYKKTKKIKKQKRMILKQQNGGWGLKKQTLRKKSIKSQSHKKTYKTTN